MTPKTVYKGYWDLFLAFSVGLGAMAVEMIASRLLAPFFGASLFVWTSLILTILLALAVGYWIGGNLAERGASRDIVGYMFVSVGGLLAVGVWFSSGFSLSLMSIVAAWPNAAAALFLGSFAATVAVIALPVMVMGALGPILLKRLSAAGDIGRASGRYLFFSTLGSAAGTLLPVLILIPRVGSRRSFEVFALFFVVIGLICLTRFRKELGLAIFVLFIIAASTAHRSAAGMLYLAESPYQLIRVLEQDGRRSLIYNEGAGVQSVYMTDAGRRTDMYFDYFSLLPLIRPFISGDHRVAVIGLAGGTAVRRYPAFLPPGQLIDFVGVEIDPAVIEAARRWFGLDALPVRVVNQDGRNFLRASREKYDSIIVDAYSTQLYIPPHLATAEFFALVRSRLRPGGILAMNINVTGEDSPLFRSLTAAVASNFREVISIPVNDSYNRIVLASDEPIDLDRLSAAVPEGYDDLRSDLSAATRVRPIPGEAVLIDDWAPVEFMTDMMILAEARTGLGLKE